ncbi:MAG TPA: aldehyde dehydrogenase family protein [Candidatus Dormibacteraeota bacterium]|nr:aldehyde dehydrogenase family protein [Candidatus Dormibacteraeota bacterium]
MTSSGKLGIRTPDENRLRIFVDGEFRAAHGDEAIPVMEAASGALLAKVPDADIEDVDAAVDSAARALSQWAATPPAERAAHLDRLQEAIKDRAEEFAQTISREVGTPIRQSRAVQVGNPITITGHIAESLRSYQFEEQVGNCLVVKEPVGVVAAITPWNYPLQQVVAKVAAALGAGSTVVLKASEVAPLTALMLAELTVDTGLPPGVFNVLTGRGVTAGEALVRHSRVDKVSFTGSTRAGRRISELAAASVKPVTMELGGKSASLVLEDADAATAAKFAVYNAFLNSGQTCTALTRLLVPARLAAQAVEAAVATASKLTLGDPLDEATRLGPLASQTQQERVRGYIHQGLSEGARLVVGGADQPDGLERGYYVKATIFDHVTPNMTIAQEEIFGPVLSIIAYDSEDEAVEIANGTAYGLAAAVWSADRERALVFARRLRAGTVEVNGGAFSTSAPFGGVKQSGHGREFGRYGIEEFLVPKSLQL